MPHEYLIYNIYGFALFMIYYQIRHQNTRNNTETVCLNARETAVHLVHSIIRTAGHLFTSSKSNEKIGNLSREIMVRALRGQINIVLHVDSSVSGGLEVILAWHSATMVAYKL